MTKLIIRRMTIDDVEAVFDIERHCFNIPWSKQSFITDITNNKCARYLVAIIDGQIIAYAGIWVVLDEGHITNIAVHKDYRSKGVGTLLTQSLLDYCGNLGVAYFTLEVRLSNIQAQNLYKKFEFIKLAVRKKYYEDNGEDALLMVSTKSTKINPDFDDVNYTYEFYIKPPM